MVELYINNFKVDLTEDISIAMTYQSEDIDKPTNAKGGYSKSVELKGTDNNNNIFSNIWKIDSFVTENTFDPNKRVGFKLFANSDLVEQGYVKLDSIKMNNGIPTYSVTLYGEICDFFYNLSYNENGDKLTLNDLYYGFIVDGKTLTEEEENKNTLFLWNKDFIKGSWSKLTIKDPSMKIDEQITAIPTYGGYYNDFASDKVILNYDSIPLEYGSYFTFNSGYTPYNNVNYKNQYILCETTREIDEWEAKDLRSNQQRYGFRTKLILDAVSNPKNNGGYNVIWDDTIINSNYYKDSWVMMNRLDFDADYSVSSNEVIKLQYTPIITNNVYKTAPATTSTSGWTSMGTFNTANMKDPYCEFNLLPIIQAYGNTLLEEKTVTTNTSYGYETSEYDESGWGASEKHDSQTDGGIVMNIAIFVNGVFHSFANNAKDWMFLTSNKGYYPENVYTDANHGAIARNVGVNNIVPITMNLTTDDIENDAEVQKVGTAFGARPYGETSYVFKFQLPKANNVQICAWATYAAANTTYHLIDPSYAEATATTTTNMINGQLYGYQRYGVYKTSDINNCRINLYENDEDDLVTNGVYDGNISPKLQPMAVNKLVLFGGTESPFDYLIGFARALGLKFRVDLGTKNVYIQERKTFYIDKVNDYTDRLDRSSYTIIPTITEYKWYQFGFDQPETYASNIYKKKNKTEYGQYLKNTNYYFNNDTKDLFDNCVYTSAIPYKHNSIYFSNINHTSSVPTILLSPTFKYTRYKQTSTTAFDTDEVNTRGYSRRTTMLNQSQDTFHRLCCFDKDNGAVDDIKNCLVFFDGFDDYNEIGRPLLSDNSEIMWILNDSACYVQASDDYEENKDDFYDFIRYVPRFTKYKTENGIYTDSLDFIKPSSTFISNWNEYNDNITLYNRYWKNYIDNMYATNSKRITIKCFLHCNPNQALREIYFFDNAYWLLYKVTDYEQGLNKPTKCDFIKLTDYKLLFG